MLTPPAPAPALSLLSRDPETPRACPNWLDPNCPLCGERLVLSDFLDGLPESLYWWDEWTCPECQEGVLIDHPGTLDATG